MSVPLLAIPIAFVLVYLSKVPLAIAMGRSSGGYDNKNPREQQANLTGWGKRAAAAHANGFEAFAPFAIGCLVAQVSGAHPALAANLCIMHLIARTVYPALYMANVDKARSAVWTVGFACSLILMALPLV